MTLLKANTDIINLYTKMSSQSQYKKIPASDSAGAGGYDKIIAIFNKSQDISAYNRANKAKVMFKSSESFERMLEETPSGIYKSTAGSDVSNIFYPFETFYGSGNKLPGFHPNASGVWTPSGNNSSVVVNINNLLPFRYDATQSGYLYYLPEVHTSGDAMRGMVSAERYYGNPENYRDISNIRSIGLRMPMVAVGWGYTTDGVPVPNQSGLLGSENPSLIEYIEQRFKGGFTNGYEVNPDDYVAAPIDLRYDPQKHVWTGPKGFWAEITGSSGVYVTGNGISIGDGSGIITAYSWKEQVMGDVGILATPTRYRYGTYTKYPAFEVNNVSTVASGTKVFLQVKEREDRYSFTTGSTSTSSTDSAGQYQYMLHMMVSQNSSGWDFGRAHPIIE